MRALAVALLLAAPAFAEPRPMPRPVDLTGPVCLAPEVMAAALLEDWGETRRSVAVDDAGRLVETYASDGGTWTIVATSSPGEPACVVWTGQVWHSAGAPA